MIVSNECREKEKWSCQNEILGVVNPIDLVCLHTLYPISLKIQPSNQIQPCQLTPGVPFHHYARCRVNQCASYTVISR